MNRVIEVTNTMRTTTLSTLFGLTAIALLAGCTVKDIDQPALAGPSTLAHSISMVAERDTLTQNGVDFTDIRITALGPNGQSESIPLRAQVFVDGIAQDYGTLSTKQPITPTTIRYTAPPGSTLPGAQQPATVTIAVTPMNGGDFRGELARQLDIRLLPQGVILPQNPFLVAAFIFAPTSPQAFQTVTFDASATTNSGVVCAQACQYAWNFGDGTTSMGITTTHQFRTAGNYPVTLTVTDSRGATATSTLPVAVSAPTPPTASFTISPTPAPTDVDVFFNASASRAVGPGRVLVSYQWSFGDGTTSSGVTTSHRYRGVGSYTVTLVVTDDAGATTQVSQSLTVGGTGSNPVANMTATPASPRAGQRISFDASTSTPSTGAVIVNYKFNFGDGTEMESTNPVQSHIYSSAGNAVASVEVTDSNGKKSTRTLAVTILP
jgi:PKD repeat protein